MAIPDCCRICALVNCAVSCAKSASIIRDREADRFSDVVSELATIESNRDWYEPKVARVLLTVSRAPSIEAIASVAPAASSNVDR